MALLIGGCLVGSGAAGAVEAKASEGAAAPTESRGKGPDARTLGVTEALLDYCAKSDPTGAAKVHSRWLQLTQGSSKQALADARKSGEYQSAHDSEADFIGKIEARNAHRLCSGAPAVSKASK